MAKETATSYRLGTDHSFPFHIKNEGETVSIDITGYALSFMVKVHPSDPDLSALLTKTTVSGIVIAGVFNATPASNLQLATVTIADTDTDALNPGLYTYELKRTDAGSETVLAYGRIEFIAVVHRT
jgi:hypothetical protein